MFDHIHDDFSRMLLIDVYNAMFKANAWNSLIDYGDAKGFQYTDKAKPILDNMNLLNLHSGSSMAWVMSHMKKIAHHGYEGYVDIFMLKNTV